MITIKRKIILSAAVLTFTGMAMLSAGQTFAQSTNGEYPSIVQKLVQKFGLKESDVKAVFDEDRTERHAQMTKKFDEYLTQAVKEGKITEAQKKLILDKKNQMMADKGKMFQDMKDKTPEERKAAMESHKKELEEWAKQNGIDLQFLKDGMGMKMKMHFKKGM